MPADHRFSGFPVALVAHIVGAALFALIGAFQFVPRLRRGTLAPARRSGPRGRRSRVVGSALWLTLFYEAQPGTGDLLYVFRLVFASALAGCLVLGFTAIKRATSLPTARG